MMCGVHTPLLKKWKVLKLLYMFFVQIYIIYTNSMSADIKYIMHDQKAIVLLVTEQDYFFFICAKIHLDFYTCSYRYIQLVIGVW